jgi:hypothetical protein
MEDVIDRSHVSRSPEELAIHFVLRHAECRNALIGRTGEDRPSDALAALRSTTTAAPVSTSSSQCGESLALNSPPAAAVTQDDTCIARFLRAYAATRHFGAEPTSGAVRL